MYVYWQDSLYNVITRTWEGYYCQKQMKNCDTTFFKAKVIYSKFMCTGRALKSYWAGKWPTCFYTCNSGESGWQSSAGKRWKTSHTIGIERVTQCSWLEDSPWNVVQNTWTQVKNAANNISITEERESHL